MISRLLFFLTLFCLLPETGFSATTRTLEVQLFYSPSQTNKQMVGYRLYQDSVRVCQTTDPTATVITCNVTAEDGQHSYELSAYFSDGSESPKSGAYLFTISTTGGGTPTPTEPAGNKLIEYAWEMTTGTTSVAGYRMYMNDTALCETTDPTATLLACSANLINAPMSFSLTSFDTVGTETLKSNFLVLDPADFPELFQQKVTTFNWDYTDTTSSAGGFQIFSNGALLCSTTDPAARSLECPLDSLQSEHSFTMAAVNAAGELTTFSNAIVYTASTTTGPTPGTLTAKLAATPTTGTSPLTVSFSAAESTGDITTYSWAFGDGDQGSGQTVSHTYSIAGSYTAILEVTDSAGQKASANTAISVEASTTQPTPPTAIIASSAATGEAPLSVAFDGSGSTAATGATITGYSWDFGDGSQGSGATINHVFTIAGTYNSQLLVTDSQGLTDTETTPVLVTASTSTNQDPVASFSATPPQGPAPHTVNFDASASSDADGTIANYIWNFGDGAQGSGKTAQHVYTAAANYTATLQVTDNDGASSAPVSKTITVEQKQEEVTLNYEIGELAITSSWVRVNFANTFTSPVVIVSPPTVNNTQAAVVRIRNLSKTGFDVRLQEWDYLDGSHPSETVSFLALEKGATKLSDGTMIEAGIFTAMTRNQSISFQKSFTSAPVVLTNVVSVNEADAVTGRLSSITGSSFAYVLQEQERSNNKHANEQVAYVAWSTGKGSVDNISFSAVLPSTGVTGNITSIALQEGFSSVPFFFAGMQTTNDSDPAALRMKSLSASKAELYAQEEQSKDSEVSHSAESIGYLAITASAAVADSAERQLQFFWEYDATAESKISGFRVFNNGTAICETTNSGLRELTCAAILETSNLFSIRAVETAGGETADSNTIGYNMP